MPERLTEDFVISQGGWHPRYARVLLIAEMDDQAMVIVDGNGDGAELELEQWLLGDEGWIGGMSSGIGPLDSDRCGVWATGWVSGTGGYAVGMAEPGKVVSVEWRNEVKQAAANEFGLWLCIFPGQPPPAEMDLPPDPPTGIALLAPGQWEAMKQDRPRLLEG